MVQPRNQRPPWPASAKAAATITPITQVVSGVFFRPFHLTARLSGFSPHLRINGDLTESRHPPIRFDTNS
jgi:hypothetical protein